MNHYIVTKAPIFSEILFNDIWIKAEILLRRMPIDFAVIATGYNNEVLANRAEYIKIKESITSSQGFKIRTIRSFDTPENMIYTALISLYESNYISNLNIYVNRDGNYEYSWESEILIERCKYNNKWQQSSNIIDPDQIVRYIQFSGNDVAFAIIGYIISTYKWHPVMINREKSRFDRYPTPISRRDQDFQDAIRSLYYINRFLNAKLEYKDIYNIWCNHTKTGKLTLETYRYISNYIDNEPDPNSSFNLIRSTLADLRYYEQIRVDFIYRKITSNKSIDISDNFHTLKDIINVIDSESNKGNGAITHVIKKLWSIYTDICNAINEGIIKSYIDVRDQVTREYAIHLQQIKDNKIKALNIINNEHNNYLTIINLIDEEFIKDKLIDYDIETGNPKVKLGRGLILNEDI